MKDLDAIEEVLGFDEEEFNEKVWEDTEFVKHEVSRGTFDNHQAIIGFEYEFYAVDSESNLARVPRQLLNLIGFEKELGLHNAEMSTSPEPLNEYGLVSQENEVKARLKAALKNSQIEGLRLVSDGIWTSAPHGEDALEYLTTCTGNEVKLAPNLSPGERYQIMNDYIARNFEDDKPVKIEVPNVSVESETITLQSLITSIQPHYQIPHAVEFPRYFAYALRTAGPLLALGVNAPFFPPELYSTDKGEKVLREAWEDHRIRVFESVYNIESEKVGFPPDFRTVGEAIDEIAEDDVYIPLEVERGKRFDENFAYFNMKRGTYWRWVRPVFEGADKNDAHLRIEFRPISGQPTVRDSIGFQALFAGLLTGLYRTEHPVIRQDWETARDNFYEAAREGIDADIGWVNANGVETNDTNEIYNEIFELAVRGLELYGIEGDVAYTYLWPLKKRAIENATPAKWQKMKVRERLNQGDRLDEAIHGMKKEYIEQQKRTLLEGSFVGWL